MRIHLNARMGYDKYTRLKINCHPNIFKKGKFDYDQGIILFHAFIKISKNQTNQIFSDVLDRDYADM